MFFIFISIGSGMAPDQINIAKLYPGNICLTCDFVFVKSNAVYTDVMYEGPNGKQMY